MSAGDLRVLYVMGIYHSGTTVLSNLVGQLDGYFAVGELRTLWPKLTRDHYRCGCGELLLQCPVWSRIIKSTFGEGEDRVTLADFRVEVTDPLEALLGSEPLQRLGAVMAVDRDGVLRGVVTIEQVARALRPVTQHTA